MRRLLTILGVLLLLPVGVEATTYTVKTSGGDYATIQGCVNIAQPGDTCLVYAGTYDERVSTVRSGTSEAARIRIQVESGTVTMKGFRILHQYVTVQGFDITGYTTVTEYGAINIFSGGSYCEILNNTIRDLPYEVRGMLFGPTGGAFANHCVVRDNVFDNLQYIFVEVHGSYHIFEGNTFQNLGGDHDFMRLWGSYHIIRRNTYKNINAGRNQHSDLFQTFGIDDDVYCNDILIEENWIENFNNGLTGYLAQMVAGRGGSEEVQILFPEIRDITFRRNVFVNVLRAASIMFPGLTLEHNTFYQCAYESGGWNISASTLSGDHSRTTIKNNVFLGCGASHATNYGQDGFYDYQPYRISTGAVRIYVTEESSLSYPNASGIHEELEDNGYLSSDGNEYITNTLRALSSIDDLVLSDTYAAYKSDLYDFLMWVKGLDATAWSTLVLDYNYVGSDTPNFYPKRSGSCSATWPATRMNFCETTGRNSTGRTHGINGGNPGLTDLTDPDGPDNIPFTADDGLKPNPAGTRILCGTGEGGTDIGAYSCTAGTVFSGKFKPPSNVVVKEP